MSELTDTVGIVALAAAGVAVLCLLLLIALHLRVRRLRGAQSAVLGEGRQDLVGHAATLQQAFVALQERVEEVAAGLDQRTSVVEDRLDQAITYRGLVRYDAYGELSGHQSMSLALLDAQHNGVVLSVIAKRDTQRLYCRQVVEGAGENELAPEEEEAIRRALAGEARSVMLDT